MLSKSKTAFVLTARRLFDEPGEKVYFWTFTFRQTHSDWDGSHCFSEFLNHLRKTLDGDWGGVKVAELHREHGIHFHCLINRRLPIDIVRRVAELHEFGRIQVEPADKLACNYLAKYLTKRTHNKIFAQSGRSLRKWEAFGPFKHQATRLKDLINYSDLWKFRRENKLPVTLWRLEAFLDRCWLIGEDTLRHGWTIAQAAKLRAYQVRDQADHYAQQAIAELILIINGKLQVRKNSNGNTYLVRTSNSVLTHRPF